MEQNGELYHRQQHLELRHIDKVTVIGVGGVGSWIAIACAMADVKELYLIDPDTVEESNRNRVPLEPMQVGQPKAVAVSHFIKKIRPDAAVIPVIGKVQDIPDHILEQVNSSMIIDSRDNILDLGKINKPKVKAGYDGFRITLHFNPDYENVFGNPQGRYGVIPSWVGTPMEIAGVLSCMIFDQYRDYDKEEIITWDSRDTAELIRYALVEKARKRSENNGKTQEK